VVDEFRDTGVNRVELSVENIPFDDAAVAHYRIDEAHGNPFSVWEEIGILDEPSPAQIDGLQPTQSQLEELRRHQELELLEEPSTVSTASGFSTDFDLPRPGVSLVLLSADSGEPPSRPTNVRTEQYRGTTIGDDLFLSWDDVETRSIRTYEVLRADTPDGPFERLNAVDLLASAYLHSPTDSVNPTGYFAVRTVDYWGRTSPLSKVIGPEDYAGASS